MTIKGIRRMDSIVDSDNTAWKWLATFKEKTLVEGNSGKCDPYFRLSQSNAIYGKSSTVTPLSLKVRYFIKY